MTRLIQESSAVGDYLWVGDHHLNREEVTELITRMQHWLKTGRLKLANEIEEVQLPPCHFCGADMVLTHEVKEIAICTKCGWHFISRN